MSALRWMGRQERKVWFRELAPACGYHPAAMARRTGITLRQLQRYCHCDWGMTPGEFLKARRMERAKEWLVQLLSVTRTARKLLSPSRSSIWMSGFTAIGTSLCTRFGEFRAGGSSVRHPGQWARVPRLDWCLIAPQHFTHRDGS